MVRRFVYLLFVPPLLVVHEDRRGLAPLRTLILHVVVPERLMPSPLLGFAAEFAFAPAELELIGRE